MVKVITQFKETYSDEPSFTKVLFEEIILGSYYWCFDKQTREFSLVGSDPYRRIKWKAAYLPKSVAGEAWFDTDASIYWSSKDSNMNLCEWAYDLL